MRRRIVNAVITVVIALVVIFVPMKRNPDSVQVLQMAVTNRVAYIQLGISNSQVLGNYIMYDVSYEGNICYLSIYTTRMPFFTLTHEAPAGLIFSVPDDVDLEKIVVSGYFEEQVIYEK